MNRSAAVSDEKQSVRLDPLKCRDGRRPNVLLAEDSPAARVLTGALLNHIGCNVDAAEHGEEALSYIKNQNYDLVLMDIEMPIMDGVVAAKEIRTMGGAAAATPIVALSAFLADTKRSSFWHQHFDVALSKPAGKHQLHATISQVLNYDLSQSKWLKVDHVNERPVLNTEVLLVEEQKLKKILSNICTADQIALLRTASEEMSFYSRKLATGPEMTDGDDVTCILNKLTGLSTSFAASALHKLARGLSADIQGQVGENIHQRITDVCDCAERTAEVLQQECQKLPGGEV